MYIVLFVLCVLLVLLFPPHDAVLRPTSRTQMLARGLFFCQFDLGYLRFPYRDHFRLKLIRLATREVRSDVGVPFEAAAHG